MNDIMETAPIDEMEEGLAELAGNHGYIVIVEPGFDGSPVFHVIKRVDYYQSMLSNWTPAPRCH